MAARAYIGWLGVRHPPMPHVAIVSEGYAVRDAEGRTVTICADRDVALAWTRIMPLTPEEVRP